MIPTGMQERLPPASGLASTSIAFALCGGPLLVAGALAWTQVGSKAETERPASQATGPGPASGTERIGQCLREGTRIVGKRGYFRTAGDRITFFTSDGTGRFVSLENLNLERVARAIAKENPARLEWSVTGTVTEYRGANYLVVESAILIGASRPRRQNRTS